MRTRFKIILILISMVGINFTSGYSQDDFQDPVMKPTVQVGYAMTEIESFNFDIDFIANAPQKDDSPTKNEEPRDRDAEE